MSWLYLIAAGFFECGFTTCLKLSDGLSKPGWAIAFVLLSIDSFGLLTLAAQKIPLGTAYAVWTGIGAVGTAILGIALFGEPATLARLACIGLIVTGIVGLKLVTGSA
jgi:quaternary ammonium compound-resistance protein SugE